MANSLDVTLLPIFRQLGKDEPELPGLHVAETPRRAARGRSADQLILYLYLAGNAPLSPGKQDQILARLAQTYYKTSGSVTAALRTVAESLNLFLLDRNVRNGSTGRQSTGLLTLVVLRGEQLYISQSGPVHAYLSLGGQTQHLFDPHLSGRGLGLSRTTPIRYYTATLQAGDALLLATHPSPNWSAATLSGISGQGLDNLRRRLLTRADLELNALLLLARPGNGRLHLVQARPLAATADRSAPSGPSGSDSDARPAVPAESEPAYDPLPPDLDLVGEHPNLEEALEALEGKPKAEAKLDTGVSPSPAPTTSPAARDENRLPPQELDLEVETPAPRESAQPVQEPWPAAQFPPADGSPSASRPTAQATAQGAEESEAGISLEARPEASPAPATQPQRPARRSLPLPPVGRWIRKLILGIGLVWSTLIRAFRVTAGRLLPGESMLTLPPALMAFIAIAVPLVVVAVSTFVYVQRGLAAQYAVIFDKASQAAAQAPQQTDPVMRRIVWETTLNYLDEAEQYQRTAESRALRLEAQNALDELNLVKRLNYQDAIIGGLPNNVIVTRMMVYDDHLYMLDGNSGTVLRGRMTNSMDYEIDPAFQCGPGHGTYLIGSIIDISPPPLGSEPGMVALAMDASGNILYCFDDDPPRPATLPAPPNAINWGSPVAFTIDPDLGHFYLLDPIDQAVWSYWFSNFKDEPTFFFGGDVPDLQSVVDLAIEKSSLYLLHEDGGMTMCTYSSLGVSPTRCEERASYIDLRPGQEGQPFKPESPFVQVMVSQPPEPSLYLLEASTRAVYRFNLRTLNFHRQYMPAGDPDIGEATAFTVNRLQRILYLAVNNRVYQASIP